MRLITVRFSHFCEKARWALDYAGLPYREESHVPILSWAATYGAGGKRTVPCLVTRDGVFSDSTDILKWVDGQSLAPPLFPQDAPEVSELEDEFDRRLGPATRRLAYFYLLRDEALVREFLASAADSGWEARSGRALFPVLKTLIIRGLRITPEGATRSEAALEDAFAIVERQLADGRRFLCGDRMTAADLTFASLATPVLVPEPLASLFPPAERVPSDFREVVERYRAKPGGQFALRLYAENRGSPQASAG